LFRFGEITESIPETYKPVGIFLTATQEIPGTSQGRHIDPHDFMVWGIKNRIQSYKLLTAQRRKRSTPMDRDILAQLILSVSDSIEKIASEVSTAIRKDIASPQSEEAASPNTDES